MMENVDAKSRVGEVDLSDFELVRRTKTPTNDLATMEDFAKIEFEAWEREPDMHPKELVPSADVMHDLGIRCRLAYAAMLRTKAQLVEMVATSDEELMDNLMADLLQGAERCKELAHMCDSAYLRILSAASVHALSTENSPPLE